MTTTESQPAPLTIDDLLRRRASLHPDRTFMIHGGQRLTYGEADKATDSLALGLLGLGLVAGDRLAVLLPNVPEFVLTFFAAAKANLLLVPINIRRSPAEVLARLEKTTPKAIVLQADPSVYHDTDHLGDLLQERASIPQLEQIIALEGGPPGVLAWDQLRRPGGVLPETGSADRLAVIVHTLGSSGRPRGAMLRHSAMVRNALGV